MGMGDAWIIGVRRIVKRAIRGVSFNECGLSHSRILQHEAPLFANQSESCLRLIGHVVCLQLESTDER